MLPTTSLEEEIGLLEYPGASTFGNTFRSCEKNPKFGHSNKIEETLRYFTVVMFIMQYKVVLTFVSVKEMLTFDNSN